MQQLLVNYYECPDCDVRWDDEWECACDDECPQCGTDVSPYESKNAHAVRYGELVDELKARLGGRGKVASALGLYPNAISHRLRNPDCVKFEHVLAAQHLLEQLPERRAA